MWTFAAFIVGFWAGIAAMCLMHMNYPNDCKQNCNQGRNCNCAEIRRKFESET